MFKIDEIMRNVPHRYPFLLIDRVLEFQEDTSVKTLKNITINEAQFQGHFPGNPIFPGVYQIENMAQSACFMLSKSSGGTDTSKTYYLGKVKNASFSNPVVPGDQLITTVSLIKKMGPASLVEAESRVDGKKVAKAEMMFSST